MSGSQETSQAEPASSDPPAPITSHPSNEKPAGPSVSTGGDGKAQEKTISCVSCRRRKLKCDRVKPKCGTCTRLRHDCEYPERRRNLGSKRRNMKELEARLAQVETKLVTESKTGLPETSSGGPHIEMDWNSLGMDLDSSIDLGDSALPNSSFDVPGVGYLLDSSIPAIPGGDFLSSELIALGLQEPLPPQDMVDELHETYFNTFHHTIPLIHKLRYYASLDRAPHMRPPIALRYAIWTMAASICEKYQCIEDVFYERARRYIDAAEMKGHGEAFVSLYHAQAWGLIGSYEAKKTYFSRAWVSVGRMVRLVQMLGLHRADGEGASSKEILPPPRDWIELEERRRTFWASFYGDRWASSGTGWPMIINEKDIETNLPASEEAFENGIMEPTIGLKEALTAEGASKISPFAGVVISAALFGHNYEHLHQKGPNERPEDLANGEFWKRHRKMDNVLSNTFMFLPETLRLPANIRNMNVVFLHMNIHASSICLHQAAVLTATRCNLDRNFIRQSRARSLMAAEEISNIMRLVSHMDSSRMNSWMGFCLYIAGGVFIADHKSDQSQSSSISHIEFILSAMQALGIKHSVTKHFTAQLELEIGAAGIVIDPMKIPQGYPSCTPMAAAVQESIGKPPAASVFNAFAEDFRDQNPMPENSEQQANSTSMSVNEVLAMTPLSGVMPSSESTSSRASPSTAPNFVPGWDSGHKAGERANPAYCPFENTENTPSSNSSVSNTMQYPYRQADSGSQNKPQGYGMYAADPEPNSFAASAEWIPHSLGGYDGSGGVGNGYDPYLNGQEWVQNQPQ